MDQDDKLFAIKNIRHKNFMDAYQKIDASVKKI